MTTNLPAVIDFTPIYPVPEDAPEMTFDITNPHLSAEQIPALNPNFMSAEKLLEWLDTRQAQTRTLTVTGCSFELLYNPLKGKTPADGEWKPCLSFAEISELLPINIPRRKQLERITRSSLLAKWVEVGQITLMVVGSKPNIQITIMPALETSQPNGKKNGQTKKADLPDDYDHQQANKDLFPE